MLGLVVEDSNLTVIIQHKKQHSSTYGSDKTPIIIVAVVASFKDKTCNKTNMPNKQINTKYIIHLKDSWILKLKFCIS